MNEITLETKTNETSITPKFELDLKHKEDWWQSGINETTLTQLEGNFLRTISKDEATRRLGFSSPSSGWNLEYPDLKENKPSGYRSFKPDRPYTINGKPKKYLRPKGEISKIFRPPSLNPSIIDDIIQPLIITEGEKKAIKAVQEGFNCLAIAGVWCFKSRKTDDSLIPDLHEIKWEGRNVYLVFDNDVVIKPEVKSALHTLAKILNDFGANVRIAYLPSYIKVNKKLGLDDYLIEYSAEAFEKLIEKAKIPPCILLDKYITKKNEGYDKAIHYEIAEEHLKDFEFIKNGIHIINNNYYHIEIKRPDNKKDQSNSGVTELIVTRKSNFIIKINREVINHNLKFDYKSEHKVKITTILNGGETKPIVLSVKELFDNKNLSEVLKTTGIHIHTLKDVEYKNIIQKELDRKPIKLNAFENPGFNTLNISQIWLTENICFDLNAKSSYLSDNNKSIKFNEEEVYLNTNKGFQHPEIKVLSVGYNLEEIFKEFPYLKEVKDKYSSCIDMNINTTQLIALSLLDNIYESYNHTIEPFLILGTATISPFVSEVFEKLQGFPIGFAGGESQSGKSNLLITIAYLFGFKQNFLKSGNDTTKNILHNLEYYSKIPVLIQETGKNLRDKIEDMLIKPVFDRTGRGLMSSGEEQNIKAINSTLIIASNDLIHRNLQTSSRLVFTDWKKDNFNRVQAKKFNTIRQNILSALFPSILNFNINDIINVLNNNIDEIEARSLTIDPRSINNIAVAKTGMDLLVRLTGINCDSLVIEELNRNYSQFLKEYNDMVSVKDSFETFLEIFELLVRDNKVVRNTDWKILKDGALAIYLKSVYTRFKEYYKRVNEVSNSIPTEKEINDEAKKRNFITQTVYFSESTPRKRCLVINLEKFEHLKSILLS